MSTRVNTALGHAKSSVLLYRANYFCENASVVQFSGKTFSTNASNACISSNLSLFMLLEDAGPVIIRNK